MIGKSIVNYRNLVVAVLIPFIAAGLQWLLWPYLQPFIWFLFYPAIFLSAWLGGRWGGAFATVLSVWLAIYLFTSPMLSFQLDNPGVLYSAAMFMVMGFLFTYVFDARKRANQRLDLLEQLHASEARYAELVQHANSAILRWRVDGTIAFCNEYAQTFFGYRAAELLGQPVGILLPEQESTGGDLTALVQDIAAHPERFKQNVNENVCRDGRRVWVAWTNTPVRNEAGQVIEILAVGTDITERKQAEEALKESEKRFATAFNISPVAQSIIAQGSNEVLAVNDTACRLFGYARQELTGASTAKLNLWQNPAERQAAVAELQTTGHLSLRETVIRTQSGEARTVLAAIEPIMWQGRPSLISSIIDITERQQAESQREAALEALRKSEQKYSVLFDQAAIPAALTKLPELVFVDVNAAFERAFGYSKQDVWGKTSLELGIARPDEQAQTVAAVQRSGSTLDSEKHIFTKSGDARVVTVNVNAVEVDGQRYAITTIYDITDRKRAELRTRYFARLYATLSQVNQTIVRVKDRQELFDAICQVAIDFGEFQLAWIGLLDPASGLLAAVAEHGLGAASLLDWRININEAPFRSGMLATALSSGQVQINNDVQHDPRMAHWHAIARTNDCHAAATIPIRQQGQVVGVLNLYAADVNFFAVEEEQKLLAEMGLDISFALDTMQMEAARQQTEAALRDSEARFSTIFELSPVAMAISRWRDFQIIEASPAFLGLCKYSREEVIGRTTVDLNLWARLEDRQRLLAEMRDHQRVANFETIIRDRFGVERNVIASGETVEIQHEPCLLIQIVDVTERKQAEAALKQSEAQYRDLFEHMVEGFAYCRMIFEDGQPVDWIYLSVNAAFETLTSLHAVTGKPVSQVIPGLLESDPELFNIYGRVARTGQPERFETFVVGLNMWFAVSVYSPKPEYFVAVFDVVTERKQAEEALRLSQENFAKAFDLNPAALVITRRADGKFVKINAAHTRLIGYEPAEIIGRLVGETTMYVNPGDRQEIVQLLQATGLIKDREIRIRTKSGMELTMLIYITPIRFNDEDCMLSALLDITDRKRAEAEIQQLNTELEQRVAQRTLQLAAANEQLTELDRLKSKFVSDVSHELRTPVTSLSLLIDLLEYGKPDRREKYVGQMKEQMARLRKLIDDILDLSRLERDRDQGGRSPVDINSIAEHVAATQFVAAEAAGLTLTCEVADNVQPVVARPDQLTRAITNVVSNAIKYTPLGTVRVQTRSQDQRVCIEVTDTGLGIPADELPHLFGRFYRGRQVAQSSIPGTGLGLSIVKEIVESHGGTVEVESELGVGSVFRIWLPTLA